MTTFTRDGHSGTGPGQFTRDGCSVEMYSRLPGNGETGIIIAAVPAGATVLELGAGAGRMTRPLVEAGLRVTAVDESEAMLARLADAVGGVGGAETVHSAIEDLDLGRQFDVVTLTSFLVNTADDAHRARLLRTCATHTAPGGCVIVQREHDGMRANLSPGDTWSRGEMTVSVVSIEPLDDDAARTCIAYDMGDERWTQTFVSQTLPEPRFEAALLEAGLTVDAYLSDDRSWVRARPTSLSAPC